MPLVRGAQVKPSGLVRIVPTLDAVRNPPPNPNRLRPARPPRPPDHTLSRPQRSLTKVPTSTATRPASIDFYSRSRVSERRRPVTQSVAPSMTSSVEPVANRVDGAPVVARGGATT